MSEPLFGPHELKTLEIDIENKIFKVNGEDFGKGCSEISIYCTPPNWGVRVEIGQKIIFERYDLHGKHIEESVSDTGQEIISDLRNPKPMLDEMKNAVQKTLSQQCQHLELSIPAVIVDLESNSQIFRKKSSLRY